MATQSLYRRYRPRRFSELKGQDHVVRALRTSVAEGREGQAYLFSGPRGTGKTTSARILAKVLNCENPQDGEPCCECNSCLAVEQGTSYDVHELDAASNNGVDAMRDLIEKASLGTPGRHKVYILDEVHMLSKGAEAALLKTLEEPPPHVVFVLATTDPQKMSDTIRSRTQHLQFHLLPVDTLEEHVKWVASEAGLEVTDAGIAQVIEQGAGSARDTLSALELVANTGGDADEVVSLDEFVEAMIDHDPGRALTMAAQAIGRGRDPRTLTEELIRELRNGFLALMAPDLVQVPSGRLEVLTDQARRLGPPGLVRGIERLGAALTDMRHAPDPRVLLDVAIVQLTSDEAGSDVGALADRLTRLERKVAEGVPAAAGTASPATGAAPASAAAAAEADPAPADSATGRKALGGRVKRAEAAAPASPAEPTGEQSSASADQPVAAVEPPADAGDAAGESAAAPAAASNPVPAAASDPVPAAPEPEPVPAPAAAVAGGAPTAAQWDQVRGGLKGMARAVFSPAEMVGSEPGSITLRLPNDTHRQKCEQHRPAVEQALATALGDPVALVLITGDGGGSGPSGGSGGGSTPGGGGGAPAARPAEVEPSAEHATPSEPAGRPMAAGRVAAVASVAAQLADDTDETPHLQSVPEPEPAADGGVESPASGRAIAEAARAGEVADPDTDPDVVDTVAYAELPDDDDVDLDDLVDAPPEAVKTPMDRLAEAFPGSELVDDVY